MQENTEAQIRDAERYKALNKEHGRHSEGLAGYLTIAGAGMVASWLFFGGAVGEPLLPGVGACLLVGGGAYWLHVRSEDRRIATEMDRIQKRFAEVGKRVNSLGEIELIGE